MQWCEDWCDKRITFRDKTSEELYQFPCVEDATQRNFMFDPLCWDRGWLRLLNEDKWVGMIRNEYLEGDIDTATLIYQSIVQIRVYQVKAELTTVYREIECDGNPYA